MAAVAGEGLGEGGGERPVSGELAAVVEQIRRGSAARVSTSTKTSRVIRGRSPPQHSVTERVGTALGWDRGGVGRRAGRAAPQHRARR